MDVLLVGKTGNGKSSVGNSILLKEAFESSDDVTSCTKGAQFDYSEFFDVIFKVVDGPGLEDTDLDRKEAFKLVLDAMTDAISVNSEGYHAILVVVRYGGKFTQEEVTTLEIMKAIFGEGFIKDHAILVMTYGDNFNKIAKKRKYTFEQCCKRHEGVFKRLLFEVENRIVLFDNMAEDNFTRFKQVQDLLEIIDGLSSKGKRYNSEMFEKARESQDRAIVESEQIILHESALREAALITQRFNEIDFHHVEKAYESLQTLLERTKKLTERINEQDRNTGLLSLPINFANDLKRFLEEETESLSNIIDNQQEKNKLLTRDWQNEEEDSDMEKDKEGNEKESTRKSKGQIARNEQEQIAVWEAFRKKRIEKENLLSSKWKEGRQQRVAKLMEKEETRGQMTQRKREETQQTEQKYFGKTKEEEIESQRVLDEKEEERRKEGEEQKESPAVEKEDQEFKRTDADKQLKPQEEKMTEHCEIEEQRQELEGLELAKHMTQLKVIEPEQHMQKGEELTREDEGMESGRKEKQLEKQELLESLDKRQETQKKIEQDKQGGDAIQQGKHATQEEVKSPNELEEKEMRQKTLEDVQNNEQLRRRRKIKEWERRSLDPVRRKKLEKLREAHIKRAEQVEEGYKSVKGETTSVLVRMRESIVDLLQWLLDKI